jgi:hypothetical protein
MEGAGQGLQWLYGSYFALKWVTIWISDTLTLQPISIRSHHTETGFIKDVPCPSKMYTHSVN